MSYNRSAHTTLRAGPRRGGIFAAKLDRLIVDSLLKQKCRRKLAADGPLLA